MRSLPTGAFQQWSSSGTIGATSFAPSVPLTVGGKLRPNGQLVPSTDQFNGTVDRAVYRTPF